MENEKMTGKRKLLLVVTYVVSLCLICGYFFILYLSMHPKTTNEYRLFYLERRLAYALTNGQLEVKTGTKYNLDGKENSDSTFYGVGIEFGWERNDDLFYNTGFCYTTQPADSFYFTGLSGKACVMKIHVADTAVSTVGVSVDDGPVENLDISAGSTIEVQIPADRVDDRGVTKVTLYPAERDGSYDRGILIDYVSFDE